MWFQALKINGQFIQNERNKEAKLAREHSNSPSHSD